jgi:hypothetical protein
MVTIWVMDKVRKAKKILRNKETDWCKLLNQTKSCLLKLCGR